MKNKKYLLKKIVKPIVALATIVTFTFTSLGQNLGCFQQATITHAPPDCSCGPYWATGTCGSGTTSGIGFPTTYDVCQILTNGAGLLVCNNTPKNVCYNYTCNTSYSWGTIALCCVGSFTCGFICGTAVVVPTPINIAGCLACLSGLGISGCFGCAIVSCTMTTGDAVPIDVYSNSGGLCPVAMATSQILL
jgi:hypothetical protein